jgi:DNA polymerase-3 subunit chi
VVVRGQGAEIDLLDKALWTFEPQEFVPHQRLRPGQPVAPHARRTPVWLMEVGDPWPEDLPEAGVLLHLGSAPCEDAPRWDRMIELVTQEGEDRSQARQRWRAYEARGWSPRALSVTAAS